MQPQEFFLSDVIVGENDANDTQQSGSIQSNVTNAGQAKYKYITCDSRNKENDR